MNDGHIHFFSEQFFATLGAQRQPGSPQSAADVVAALGWDQPGTHGDLADRWVNELDRRGVRRAALIASVPGDEESVAHAVARHPGRFVGFFMLDPTAQGAAARGIHALDTLHLRTICLFPAMQRYALHDPRVTRGRPDRVGTSRHGSVRPLRGVVCRRAEKARPSKPVRRPAWQPARRAGACRGISARAVHHSALRGRAVFARRCSRRTCVRTCTSTPRARTAGWRMTLR